MLNTNSTASTAQLLRGRHLSSASASALQASPFAASNGTVDEFRPAEQVKTDEVLLLPPPRDSLIEKIIDIPDKWGMRADKKAELKDCLLKARQQNPGENDPRKLLKIAEGLLKHKAHFGAYINVAKQLAAKEPRVQFALSIAEPGKSVPLVLGSRGSIRGVLQASWEPHTSDRDFVARALKKSSHSDQSRLRNALLDKYYPEQRPRIEGWVSHLPPAYRFRSREFIKSVVLAEPSIESNQDLLGASSEHWEQDSWTDETIRLLDKSIRRKEQSETRGSYLALNYPEHSKRIETWLSPISAENKDLARGLLRDVVFVKPSVDSNHEVLAELSSRRGVSDRDDWTIETVFEGILKSWAREVASDILHDSKAFDLVQKLENGKLSFDQMEELWRYASDKRITNELKPETELEIKLTDDQIIIGTEELDVDL